MIITVTLNPAVDKTIYVKDFRKGEVNKIEYSIMDPGGKGINVSRVVKNLNCKTVALGFIGGENGQYIENSLRHNDINSKFTKVESETRTNLKIVDLNTGDTTDINEKGREITEYELKSFINTYKKALRNGDIVVLSGSVPKGINTDIYKILAEIGHEKGCKVILDVSGEYLKRGIMGNPYMIKPNIDELEEIVGMKLETIDEIVKVCNKLIGNGIEFICVSMGSRGAILIGKDFVLQGKIPRVKVKSTVGAGDSLVAGFAAGLSKGFTVTEAFRLGLAASVIAVTKEGTKAATLKEIEEITDDIEILEGKGV